MPLVEHGSSGQPAEDPLRSTRFCPVRVTVVGQQHRSGHSPHPMIRCNRLRSTGAFSLVFSFKSATSLFSPVRHSFSALSFSILSRAADTSSATLACCRHRGCLSGGPCCWVVPTAS